MLGDPADPITGGYDSSVLADIQRTQMQLNTTLAQFQLNFKEEVERFELLLSGIVRNESGKLVQVHEPILNERGRTHIMKKVRTWMTKIVAQSDFNDEMICKWCLTYSRELISDACHFGDLWDLRQDEFTSFVNDLIFSLYSIMSSARNGGLREIIGKISKVVESFSSVPAPRRMSL